MILVDFSSIVHRMIFTAVKRANPKKIDGKFVTSEFAPLVTYMILQELFTVQQLHSNKFGEIIICLDDKDDPSGYWRRDYHAQYKQSRRNSRDESEINFDEIFSVVTDLTFQITQNLPWKVICVARAEADDTMLILAKQYKENELILIYSPDKDMLQAQRNTENVFQYSSLTKKWLTPESKSENMDSWIQEHCILGDVSDEVPKVVDATEFSDTFLSFLEKNRITETCPHTFKQSDVPDSTKIEIINTFNVYKENRKGESTGVKDIYKSIRFGPSTLKKKIKEFGDVETWLNSHPLYRKHYDRNFILVMEEGIPRYIRDDILMSYKSAETNYNDVEFINFLNSNGLKSTVMELPNYFKVTRDLSAEDFGW